MENSIVLRNVSKKYILSQERPILLKNLFLPQKKEEVWALKNVSLTIKKGETIGIIGENGSGKSTLLKIIAGITTPTSGTVAINGKVASLIELGAGFHQDLTGRENIYLNGSLLGLTRNEIDKKYQEIVDFADIGKFINQPIRTYSSGMVVRLGFSVAVHLDPDILLIDEVLAVGDEEFQRKCIDKIEELKKYDTTILFVSHNLSMVLGLCKKVVLFSHGKINYMGDPRKTIDYYLDMLNILPKDAINKLRAGSQWGSREAEITNFSIIDRQGNGRKYFFLGEPATLRIFYKINKAIKSLVFGFSIHKNGMIAFSANSQLVGIHFRNLPSSGFVDYSISTITLSPGRYLVSIAICGEKDTEVYNWHEQKYSFEIRTKVHLGTGYTFLDGKWHLGK